VAFRLRLATPAALPSFAWPRALALPRKGSSRVTAPVDLRALLEEAPDRLEEIAKMLDFFDRVLELGDLLLPGDAEGYRATDHTQMQDDLRRYGDSLPRLLDVVEAARNISGLQCGAWPELAAALSALDEQEQPRRGGVSTDSQIALLREFDEQEQG
jgi:hypothetical protein